MEKMCRPGRMSVAETIYVAVNVLFVAKYSARIAGGGVLPAALCVLLAIAAYAVLLRWLMPRLPGGDIARRTSSGQIACGVVLLAFAGMATLQYAIDPYGIQVDRWSALHFPIRNLLSGTYPYSACTHLGGYASPFPVWQVLHIPFYLLGNVGLSFFVAAILFLCSCRKVQGREGALAAGLLLCSSVAVWYEAAVRSDLITNMLLLAAIVNYIFPRLSQQWVEKRRWRIACGVGLLASTRIIVLVPVALLLCPYLSRMKLRRQCEVTLLALIVFALTFVPFALWDWQEFYYFQNNPWALQTRQGSLPDFVLFVPLGLFLAWNHGGDARRYYRNTAAMLCVFVLVTFLHNMWQSGNWALFSSSYDITYFTSAIPFCLLAYCVQRRQMCHL
ncbi:MAG: hypothetical protein J1F27_02630 [Prevotellaceae bacterium]|nr:hypothetical protein [Prevotellaceae bacterium]